MSQRRRASASPGRIDVPRSTSITSRTCPSGLGPFTPGPVRHAAAATRIACTCSSVSVWIWFLGLASGEVPSTGLRGIASCRSANEKSWLSTVRECFAREYDTARSAFRNHSTRPVVISPSA